MGTAVQAASQQFLVCTLEQFFECDTPSLSTCVFAFVLLHVVEHCMALLFSWYALF